MPSQPQGPICQSCSMPLTRPEDFGTESGGSPSDEYCHLCYRDGAFVGEVTIEQMIDLSARGAVEAGVMPEEQAPAMLREVLPQLKRWREA